MKKLLLLFSTLSVLSDRFELTSGMKRNERVFPCFPGNLPSITADPDWPLPHVAFQKPYVQYGVRPGP